MLSIKSGDVFKKSGDVFKNAAMFFQCFQ